MSSWWELPSTTCTSWCLVFTFSWQCHEIIPRLYLSTLSGFNTPKWKLYFWQHVLCYAVWEDLDKSVVGVISLEYQSMRIEISSTEKNCILAKWIRYKVDLKLYPFVAFICAETSAYNSQRQSIKFIRQHSHLARQTTFLINEKDIFRLLSWHMSSL